MEASLVADFKDMEDPSGGWIGDSKGVETWILPVVVSNLVVEDKGFWEEASSLVVLACATDGEAEVANDLVAEFES